MYKWDVWVDGTYLGCHSTETRRGVVDYYIGQCAASSPYVKDLNIRVATMLYGRVDYHFQGEMYHGDYTDAKVRS